VTHPPPGHEKEVGARARLDPRLRSEPQPVGAGYLRCSVQGDEFDASRGPHSRGHLQDFIWGDHVELIESVVEQDLRMHASTSRQVHAFAPELPV
jgi:hypothetical protein